MSLDDIVDLTITLESSSVTKAGFGTPMIVDYNTRFTDTLVRSYSKLSDVADDYETYDAAYLAASKMFAQSPRPRTVKIGRRTAGAGQVFEWTPATAINTVYSFDLALSGGAAQTVSFTSSATGNSAEILTGLSAAIAALSGYTASGVTAATATGLVRLTSPGLNGPRFAVSEINANFSLYDDTTANSALATHLNSIVAEDDDWYGFITTEKGATIQAAAAGWVETQRKFYVGATMDSDVIVAGSSDVASTLQALAYTRTALLWNDGAHAHHDAALLGKWLPYVPGEETVKFKTLAGVAATHLTSSQLAQLVAKNCNHYRSLAGVSIVTPGVVCEGEFMDVIRFIDWLYANIQEEVYAVLTGTKKVPFTDPGVAQIEGAVRAVLKRGVTVGGLAADPAFTVTVPLVADVSAANKASRTLPDVDFIATLAGAIHIIEITGTVSV